MNRRGRFQGALALMLLAALPPAFAQQQESDDSEDIGKDTTLVPRPSELAPRATSALLLGLAKAGDAWVAVGQRGTILRSTDAEHWQQTIAPADTTLNRVRFFDPQHGWAVGYDGTVLASEDGGKSWRLAQFDAAWGRPWFDVLFFDKSSGLLAGANGAFKRTADGGETWTDVETPVLADQPNLYNLIPLGDGSLLLAGERGFLAHSKDRGQTWQQLKSPYTGSYFGAVAIGERSAVVFGLRGNAFYAADLDKAAALTAKELEALRAAALDPQNAASGASPVSTVNGWVRLANTDTEPLFGGTVDKDGGVVLVGQNGRVMRADPGQPALKPLASHTDINMNAVLTDGDSLVVVGTSGVKRIRPE